MSKFENIYFIGFRAVGKTTLAGHISRKHGLFFLDTDQKLQQEAGMSIEDMVADHGWQYFRDMEEKVLYDTTKARSLVVSAGGGIVLRESNRRILKDDKYLTVYLRADPHLILDRLKAEPNPRQRPPLSTLSLEEEILETLAQREPLYQECADLVLDAREAKESLGVRVMGLYTSTLSK